MSAGCPPAQPVSLCNPLSPPACSVLPVQVRLQTQTTYRGIVDCMVKTYRHESVGDLGWGVWGREASGRSGPASFSPSRALPPQEERKKIQVWGYWGWAEQ